MNQSSLEVMKFDKSVVEEVIKAPSNKGSFAIHAEISFTAERVLVVRGILTRPEQESLRHHYIDGTKSKHIPWIEDESLAAAIGAVLVIGNPEQLEKFRKRLLNRQREIEDLQNK